MSMTAREARQAWVAALRSGEYEQARSALRTNEGRCCLGVACDVFAQIHGIGRWVQIRSVYEFILDPDGGPGDGEVGQLPLEVRDWLGLSDSAGVYYDTDDGEYDVAALASLAEDNDNGLTFEQIADRIEAAPHGLIAS